MSKRLAKKVLLIGWDAADWKVINPLMDQGLMPTLNKLVNGGVIGKIATLDPPLSPMLWTSIATGKTADKHGILGFIEPDTTNMTVRPSLSTSRKVKAIWNILTQEKLKTHVVGWWPSHPAEPINGVMVSNFYQKTKGQYGDVWPIAPGTIHPKEMEEVLAEFRVHPGEITGAHIAPIIPNFRKLRPDNKRLKMLVNILSHAGSIQGAATWIMENKEWDFMAVYFDAIDHCCHSFMRFYPPRREGISQEAFDIFSEAVNGGYRFHDMMLERMLQLAGDDTTVLLLSDHGFHSDHLRPNKLPKEPAGPAYEHSPYGVFVLNGPGILKDERVYGATLLDVAPTLLTLFGLPIGKDMDGKPLVQVFKEKPEPDYIESWELVEGEAGRHASDLLNDPWAMKEAMQQLIELGYVEDPGDDKKGAMEKAVRESQYYLSRVYMYKREFDKATEILEKLFAEDQSAIRYGLSLASCYHSAKRLSDCRKVVDQLKLQKLDNTVKLDLIEANLLMAEHKHRQALELLKGIEVTAGHLTTLHNQVAKIYSKMFRWEEAKSTYLKTLTIDPNNSVAHMGVATSHLRMSNYEEAAEEALNAIGLLYHYPKAHYTLGEALYYLQDFERSAQAFEVCCTMNPGNRKAHFWLVKLYREHLNDLAKAEQHEKFIDKNIMGTIYIVSGLPRSGTSMMMQMLQAGGMEILTDHQRKDDDNNPRGYFEFEKVKGLLRDNSWLKESNGKVLKVVAPLLIGLPNTFQYKIIFMQRELEEILRSQQIMLGKKSPVEVNAYPMALADAFKKQMEKAEVWMRSNANIEVLNIDYRNATENPREVAEQVCDFLDLDVLDVDKMVAAVDPSLYRNKLISA